MATTTNYSWTTPDDTALVKDGAAAIRSLGTAIDTTVFNNAGAAIAKSIVDAKGDIIAATADNTVSKLSVGANATVLTADSSTATGLKWAIPAGFSPSQSVVATNQNTTSSTYTDLATAQSVTLTTGTKALLFFSVGTYNTSNFRNQQIGVEVSGATSITPGTPNGQRYYATGGDGNGTASYDETTCTKVIYYTGLTAGSNTFTLKFKTSGGDGYFYDRYLVVADMGS